MVFGTKTGLALVCRLQSITIFHNSSGQLRIGQHAYLLSNFNSIHIIFVVFQWTIAMVIFTPFASDFLWTVDLVQTKIHKHINEKFDYDDRISPFLLVAWRRDSHRFQLHDNLLRIKKWKFSSQEWKLFRRFIFDAQQKWLETLNFVLSLCVIIWNYEWNCTFEDCQQLRQKEVEKEIKNIKKEI